MFDFEATAIGSMPFKDPEAACRLIFETFGGIPFWPQLPKRSFRENMYAQFSERLPGLIIDDKEKSLHIDTSKAAEGIQEMYERYIAGDVPFFAMSEEYAAGFYAFLDMLKAKKSSGNIRYVKGHITGPVSFSLSLTDEKKQSVIYNKELLEVLTKLLVMKARWQARKLKELFPKVIIFIDEPYLVSIGSSYVNINIEEVSERIGELINAIKEEGALCGIHCCGNTDWSFLLKRDIDIISFDAYNFMNEFLLYADDVKGFLGKGGTIAWGVVPSSDAIDGENDTSLESRLGKAVSMLKAKGIGDSVSSLVTPSCGVGSLDERRAEKVLRMAGAVSVRRRTGKPPA